MDFTDVLLVVLFIFLVWEKFNTGEPEASSVYTTQMSAYDRGMYHVYIQHVQLGKDLEDIMNLTEQCEWVEIENDDKFVIGVKDGIKLWTRRNLNNKILHVGDTNGTT